jgi:hypothetical protein
VTNHKRNSDVIDAESRIYTLVHATLSDYVVLCVTSRVARLEMYIALVGCVFDFRLYGPGRAGLVWVIGLLDYLNYGALASRVLLGYPAGRPVWNETKKTQNDSS